MPDLLLTQQERERFASWLEHEASAAREIIKQMEKLGALAAPVIQREKAEMMAALVIARKLRSIEDQTIGG